LAVQHSPPERTLVVFTDSKNERDFVKDLDTGKVEITSMNHGFTVDSQTLPKGVLETHVSLFDGSNCGIRLAGKPVFSVQYHPEASPGPQDSYYLFERFAEAMRTRRAA
jgi:carbamoyl-phosphate synthase small subunit